LGMPPRHPFFIGKNQVTFQHTILLLLHILCFFLERLYFCFQFCFCFVCCNKWLDDGAVLMWELLLLQSPVTVLENFLVFCWRVIDDVNDRPVGNPKRRCDEHSSKFSLSYETKVCQSSRKNPNSRR
jgi:hypothetical protein